MALIDTINADLKDAMKARDAARTNAIRNIRSAFLEALKVDGKETLTDEQAITVLRGLSKRRAESITAYDAAGRPEMADAERAELAVIEAYLPQLADEATVTGWVEAAIAATGATGPKDMGKVMGKLNAEHKGTFDGGLASAVVKARLAALG
ncbi:MAG: hypothetical protein RLZZ383_1175 [Pseudomonadota bacterium]|jgi:uncharacterized protein YqeY